MDRGTVGGGTVNCVSGCRPEVSKHPAGLFGVLLLAARCTRSAAGGQVQVGTQVRWARWHSARKTTYTVQKHIGRH